MQAPKGAESRVGWGYNFAFSLRNKAVCVSFLIYKMGKWPCLQAIVGSARGPVCGSTSSLSPAQQAKLVTSPVPALACSRSSEEKKTGWSYRRPAQPGESGLALPRMFLPSLHSIHCTWVGTAWHTCGSDVNPRVGKGGVGLSSQTTGARKGRAG